MLGRQGQGWGFGGLVFRGYLGRRRKGGNAMEVRCLPGFEGVGFMCVRWVGVGGGSF